MQENSNIFDESSGCIRQEILLKYLKGKLSGKERNLVERHLQECEMCSDELEGLSNLSEPDRIAEIEADINSMVDKRTTPRILWLDPKVVYRVAAVAVLTIGVSTLLYYFVLKTTPSTMMSESQMPSASAEMSDSVSPLGVTSIPKDVTEYSELQKKESKQVERLAAPKVVADNMKVADDIFVDEDSEVIVLTEAEMEEVEIVPNAAKPDSTIFASNDAAITAQRTEAARAANAEARKEEVVTVAEGAKLSKKLNAFAGESAQPQIVVEGAIKNFNKKNYQEALGQFNVLYAQNANNDTVVYFRAMCSYNLKSFADAIVDFQKLMKDTESEFLYDSQWYCALSLIETGRKDEARSLLELISKSNSPYKDLAKQKLDR